MAESETAICPGRELQLGCGGGGGGGDGWSGPTQQAPTSPTRERHTSALDTAILLTGAVLIYAPTFHVPLAGGTRAPAVSPPPRQSGSRPTGRCRAAAAAFCWPPGGGPRRASAGGGGAIWVRRRSLAGSSGARPDPEVSRGQRQARAVPAARGTALSGDKPAAACRKSAPLGSRIQSELVRVVRTSRQHA